MKANELRIGNWIHFDGYIGRPYDYQVTPEFFRAFSFETDLEISQFYKPIPLTEEWLLRFGFLQCGINNTSNNSFYGIAVGTSELLINPDNGVVWIQRDENIFNNPALINYVHQLQNLIFALTGKELNINT